MLEEQYFEDEVREGFFVPSMVKRAWAAQLEVLAQIDRICAEYDIQYFAEWGTLLGAVRHNGFIPWDDDLDIGMKRADYEKFLKVAPKELPEGYIVNNCRNRDDFWLFLARVMNTSHMCFEDEFLRQNHEFPYIAGVDIFLMDYVARDEEKEKNRDTIADFTINLADYIYEQKISGDEAIDGLRKINDKSRESLIYDETLIKRWLSENHISNGSTKDTDAKDIAELHQKMYMYAERMFAMFREEEADELTQLFPFGLRKKEHRYSKEYYEDCVRLPFENITIPVPVGYDAMLRRRYGDYMKIFKNCSGHNYPFFEGQREQLDKLLDTKLPSYEYSAQEMKYANGSYTGTNRAASFGQLASEVCGELEKYDDAQAAQALAIDFGTMVEKVYGEGHDTISYLEDYCEQLYLYSQGSIEEAVLKKSIQEIKKSVRTNIIDVKETAFIVSKVSQWIYIEREFEHTCETGTQIYIVVVPYYHKRYDGSLYDEHNEYELFMDMNKCNRKNVHIVRYDEYNIKLHHPDCVYIQNPYDGWNSGVSIHPSYYTDNIVENCDSMVYVPPFALDEFTNENYREYHNMSAYVTVPGVVRSDAVIVQSESMKKMYADKLSEWAGEDTRKIWNGKIIGTGTQSDDIGNVEYRQKCAFEKMPASWKSAALLADGKRKKIVLYHNEAAMFMENGEKAFFKIKASLETFEQNRDDIFLIWNISEETEKLINKKMPQYSEMLNRLKKYAARIGACDISDGKMAQAVSDAFYGDGCYLSRLCQIDGKPVMLESVEIMSESESTCLHD